MSANSVSTRQIVELLNQGQVPIILTGKESNLLVMADKSMNRGVVIAIKENVQA